MDQNRCKVRTQIACFYYPDLSPASRFYQEIMGFELVQAVDEWFRVYRTSANAFLAIVNEERGFHKAQQKNAVLVVLVVDDVSWWYDHLRCEGAKVLTAIQEMRDIRARCFFVEDPGGYTIEIEQFLEPEITLLSGLGSG
jgi:predicted enzyme related to lactoylglutathione lyase